MENNNKFYITCAIDYPVVNRVVGGPHIGTAFEKIGADVQARFQRFIGRDVYFLMGNDENTIRVVHRAQQLDEPVQQYVNRMAEEFKKVWKALDISNDDFIQTSEERHRIGVQKFIKTVYDAGYIYKKKYKGWYCEGCEEYKLEKNLMASAGLRVCPNHPLSIVTEREEENYFFKLSEFKRWILDLYFPAFDTPYIEILPECRLNEMTKFVEAELDDISISRNNEGWGIPIPWDHSQVIYVWFDALLNYLTGIGYGTDPEKFKIWWSGSDEDTARRTQPATVHIVGKDITRFHCALWPAMIAAYNKKAEKPIPYPEKVFAHGFITQKKGDEQVKIGKSTGAFVDPVEVVAKYGSDAYRYYFMSKCSFSSDGEYSSEHFDEVYNAELANNLGNLASRVGNMILKNQEGRVPNFSNMFSSTDPLKEMPHPIQFELKIGANFISEDKVLQWVRASHDYDYRKALSIIWDVLTCANKYLDDHKPWKLLKKSGKKTEQEKLDDADNFYKCSLILRNAVIMIRLAAIMLKPYLPKASKAIYDTYLFPVKWEDLDWKYFHSIVEDNDLDLEKEFTLNPAALVKDENNKVGNICLLKYPVLFPRLEKTT